MPFPALTTGSPTKSTIPSDPVEQVRITAAPSVAMPLTKEGARPPLAPSKGSRRSGAKQSAERHWEQQDLRSISPKHDTGREKTGAGEGKAERARTERRRLMKGAIRREATETVKPQAV